MDTHRIDHRLAKPFIEEWHYSGKCPTGKNIFFGCYDGAGLYAVADYGIGVNPYQATFLSRESSLDVTNDALVELKRLCRIEPRNDDMPLTKFLSQCHRQLKQEGVRFVVSFSDPEHGHTGGIYRAANFIHLGQSNPEFHLVDADGVVRHRRYAYRYAQRNGVTTAQARDDLGLTRIKTAPKDRWFLPLHAKDRAHMTAWLASSVIPSL